MMNFQPDGFEIALVLVPFVLSLFAIPLLLVGIISVKLGLSKKELPPEMTLWWLIFPVMSSLFFGGWIYDSAEGVKKLGLVDEVHYFEIVPVKYGNNPPIMMFTDNQGRFLRVDRFTNDPITSTQIVKKQVFRGRCLLLSWEWMEFSVVPKLGVGHAVCRGNDPIDGRVGLVR